MVAVVVIVVHPHTLQKILGAQSLHTKHMGGRITSICPFSAQSSCKLGGYWTIAYQISI